GDTAMGTSDRLCRGSIRRALAHRRTAPRRNTRLTHHRQCTLVTSLGNLALNPRVRVRHGPAVDPRGRCVVYRMRRAQRTLDNPALNTAIAAANALGQPVVVFFGLLARGPMANLRHYTFMLEGLAETARK